MNSIPTTGKVLADPDLNSQFMLTTDASKVAVAAILSQVQDEIERPISYASRQMNKAEQNYSASEALMITVTWGTTHFRCYLYGKRFTLRTDHAALKYLHTFADSNSRLLRLSLRLSEFDFVVEHRPGTQIRLADALRRTFQVLAQEQELSREVVKTAQAGDKFYQSLKPCLAASKSEYFTDEKGLTYRRRKNGEHQLVVPVNLVNWVIKMNHDPVTVAHPGRSRTLDILCLRFYWPGMCRHVEEYVKNCHACQR
jgi:hypothetical protein